MVIVHNCGFIDFSFLKKRLLPHPYSSLDDLDGRHFIAGQNVRVVVDVVIDLYVFKGIVSRLRMDDATRVVRDGIGHGFFFFIARGALYVSMISCAEERPGDYYHENKHDNNDADGEGNDHPLPFQRVLVGLRCRRGQHIVVIGISTIAIAISTIAIAIVVITAIKFAIVFFFFLFQVFAVLTIESLRTGTSRGIFPVFDLALAHPVVYAKGKVCLAHSRLSVLGANIGGGVLAVLSCVLIERVKGGIAVANIVLVGGAASLVLGDALGPVQAHVIAPRADLELVLALDAEKVVGTDAVLE